MQRLGVLLGQSVTETITLENKGLADLEGVTLQLIGENYQPVPNWVVLNATIEPTTLKVGEKRPVSVTFAPTTNTPEGLYTYYLRVQAADYPVTDIGLYVSATPSGHGNALFKIKNIFAGTLNAQNEVIQGLAGARITVQNEKNLTIVYDETSDTFGEALFSNLSAGIYKYRAQAPGHQEKIGRLWIKPGITASEEMFLEYNFVTVEWEVVETTIQDKYEIVLNITYETDVPAPVVVCEPASVSLPDLKAGDVLNGEFTLTNKGLVRADNLKVNIPADDQYIQYELLAPIPTSIGAKERITVPYRMTCIQSLVQDEVISGGADTGCYRSCFTTSYEGVSSNGCPYKGAVPYCFFHPCGTIGSTGAGTGWGWTWHPPGGPGHTGSGGGIIPHYTSISSAGAPCTPPPEDDENSRCAGDGGQSECEKDCNQAVCQAVGSWAHLYMRSYTDEAKDLSVKVPGGSIDITRSFFNEGLPQYRDSWFWKHERQLTFDIERYDDFWGYVSGGRGAGPSSVATTAVLTALGGKYLIVPVRREGLWYYPDQSKPLINLGAGEQIILRPKKGSKRISYVAGNTWRWEDKEGNWEEYSYSIANLIDVDEGDSIEPLKGRTQKAQLTSYGDHYGAIAKISPLGITDRDGRQVIWIERAPAANERTITTIRDNENRTVEYETSKAEGTDCYPVDQTLLHRFKDVNGHETTYTYGVIPSFQYSEKTGSSGYSTQSTGGSGGGGSSSVSCVPPPRIGLTSITDALGRKKSIDYGGDGAVSSVLDDENKGYHFQFSYDQETREYYAQVRDTNGLVKEVWIDTGSEATRVDVNGRTVKTFAKAGNTYTITDENGNRTQKTYDEWDNLVKVVYPDGAEVKYEYDPTLHQVTEKIDENQVVTRYYYDTAGRLERRVEAFDTDLQRTTEFSYDTAGNLATIRRPGDADTAEVLTTMTYDTAGNMLSLTDPEGGLTSFTYDVAGNVLTKTDPRNQTWRYTYDGTGRLATVTDPLNLVTEYFYDEVGNKVREKDPTGKQTLYEYDIRDNLQKSINPALEATQIENTFDGRVLTQTDPEGRKVGYEYDADQRLSRNIDGNGNVIDLSYSGDTTGCSSCGSGAGSGDQPTVIQFPTFTREIKYDGRGRKYAERDVLDNDTVHLTRYTYDAAGNLTAKTDPEGKVTTYEYDLLNRLTRVIDADNGWTSYAYDKRDNLIALTDAENHTTHFAYDRNNRLVTETRPMGEETHYAYDDAGNLIEKTDAKDQRSEYHYDDAGRLTEIRYYAPGESSAAKTVTFTYDPAGNLTGYNDGTTSATYTYDDADRKTTETVNYPGFAKTNRYTYYKNGLKASFTGPDNIPIGYLYDSNNQLTGVQIPNVGMFTVNKYAWNRPAEETLPGGGKRLYQYDPLMRVADIVSQDPGDNQQLNYGYTYDKVDNITAKQTEHGDYGYQYDSLYRLTDADNPDQPDEAFDYDRVGNRIGAADTTGPWTHNANNELAAYGNTTFQYDANGNMIEKNVGGTITRFFYNLEDRLERVEDSSGSVISTYYYDPFGRRLWKEVGATRTCFHYNDEGLIGEYAATGSEIKAYGWKSGSTWGTNPLFMKVGTEYYWYHNDHLGTPQMMTTSSGAVVWKAKYVAFGKATVDSASIVVNPLRFPGQYEDAETGLHYNYKRYYDQKAGRYLNHDPIGLNGGFNLFRYVYNNPVNFYDSMGECSYAVPLVFVGLVLYVVAVNYVHTHPVDMPTFCSNSWDDDAPEGIYVPEAGIVIVIPGGDPGKKKRCKEELERVTEFCVDTLASHDPPKGVCGPAKGGGWSTVAECIQNVLEEECGGKPVQY